MAGLGGPAGYFASRSKKAPSPHKHDGETKMCDWPKCPCPEWAKKEVDKKGRLACYLIPPCCRL